MTDWLLWLCAAGVLVILELLSGTFYLLMVALGAAAGALAAYGGVAGSVQFMIAAIVGVTATVCLNRSRFGTIERAAPASDQHANLDIGQSVQVDVWHARSDGTFTARAMYRGAQWDIEYVEHIGSLQTTPPAVGSFVITDLRGSCLLVTASPSIAGNQPKR